jgi:uncharacterized membrane protein (DUF485 family)
MENKINIQRINEIEPNFHKKFIFEFYLQEIEVSNINEIEIEVKQYFNNIIDFNEIQYLVAKEYVKKIDIKNEAKESIIKILNDKGFSNDICERIAEETVNKKSFYQKNRFAVNTYLIIFTGYFLWKLFVLNGINSTMFGSNLISAFLLSLIDSIILLPLSFIIQAIYKLMKKNFKL